MLPLTRILVAADASAPARAAFAQALALSRAHGAALTVLQAVPPSEPFGWRGRERAERIGEWRRRAAAHGVRLEVEIQHGDATGVILLHAASRPYDLLVIGSHRRTGLDRLRRGSIAEGVLQRATLPVLIAPGRGAAGPRSSFAHVLVGFDLGLASTAALAQARLLADRTGRVVAVHVTRRRAATAATTEAMDALQRRLTRALGPTVDARMVAGDASAGIVRLAQAIRADLIVLGVSRRGAIAHRLRSATAARVMRAVACPILAVPERRLEEQRPEHGPAGSVPERRDRLRPAA